MFDLIMNYQIRVLSLILSKKKGGVKFLTTRKCIEIFDSLDLFQLGFFTLFLVDFRISVKF